jgi:hypothetical protein
MVKVQAGEQREKSPAFGTSNSNELVPSALREVRRTNSLIPEPEAPAELNNSARDFCMDRFGSKAVVSFASQKVCSGPKAVVQPRLWIKVFATRDAQPMTTRKP